MALICAALLGLNYIPIFESLPMPSDRPGEIREIIMASHPTFRMELARIDYSLLNNDTVEIEKLEVLNQNNYRKGLSQALLHKMLEAHPQIRHIEVVLGDVNLQRYLQTGDFAQTPIAKAAAKLGFHCVEGNCNFPKGENKFLMTFEPPH